MNRRGNYFIYDRLKFLENAETVTLKGFCLKFECSRSAMFRDMEHLRDFYDIEFVYDRHLNLYRRVH